MDALGMLGLLQKAIVIAPEKRNVGTKDRIFSSAAGILLAYVGMRNFKKGGFALLLPAGYLLWRGTTGYCQLYNLTGTDTTEGAEPFEFSKTITIQRDRDEVYHYWRQLENLPYIMTHVAKVEKLSDNKYRWEAEFNKQHFSWNAEIIEDIQNERISWMSADAPDVENAGTVEFIDAPDGGTQLRVTIIYKPAKSELGRMIAKVFNPIFKQKVKDDLLEFRNKIESGEIIISRPYAHV